MENKYFTPGIEDIRVGYECEMLNGYGEWKPFKFEEHLYYEGWAVDFGKMRVPYLTKKQIEDEGWTITHREYKEPPYKMDWVNAKKGGYTLWINLGLTDSMFLGIDKEGAVAGILFRGHCKDINTFRYICKLLNI